MTGESVDRRKKERKLLTFFSRVIDNTNGRLLGYLVDMSANGALIVGNLALKVNSEFALRFDLPEDYAEKQQLLLTMKVIWCQPDPDPELYRTGLKLVRAADSDLTIMQKMIAEYGLNKVI